MTVGRALQFVITKSDGTIEIRVAGRTRPFVTKARQAPELCNHACFAIF